MRCHGQNASLSQQSAPRRIGNSHSPKLASIKIRNPIVPRQALVHERVVRRQEIENVSVFTNDTFEEQFRLAPERLTEVVIEIRKQVGIRQYVSHVSQP